MMYAPVRPQRGGKVPAPADAVSPIVAYAFNPGCHDLFRAKDGDCALPSPKFFADLVLENGSGPRVLEHVPSGTRPELFLAIFDHRAPGGIAAMDTWC